MTQKTEEEKAKALKIDTCLQYCKEHNGTSVCKNCGLSQEMIDEVVLTAERRGKTEAQLELLHEQRNFWHSRGAVQFEKKYITNNHD